MLEYILAHIWPSGFSLWANIGVAICLLVALVGFCFALHRLRWGLRYATINQYRRFSGPRSKWEDYFGLPGDQGRPVNERVARIVIARLATGRHVGGRDVLSILLKVCDDIGIAMPMTLGWLKIDLSIAMERAEYLVDNLISDSAKQRVVRQALANIRREIESWSSMVPGAIREANRRNWICLLGVASSICFVAAFNSPPISLFWILGGMLLLALIDFENYVLGAVVLRRETSDSSALLVGVDDVEAVAPLEVIGSTARLKK